MVLVEYIDVEMDKIRYTVIDMAKKIQVRGQKRHTHTKNSVITPTYDLVQPKMSLTLSFSGMYKNHLFIVGIGPIPCKEIEFIYQSDRSDRTYVYS